MSECEERIVIEERSYKVHRYEGDRRVLLELGRAVWNGACMYNIAVKNDSGRWTWEDGISIDDNKPTGSEYHSTSKSVPDEMRECKDWPIGDKREVTVDGEKVWVQCAEGGTCDACCTSMGWPDCMRFRCNVAGQVRYYPPCDPPEVGDVVGLNGKRYKCVAGECDDCDYKVRDCSDTLSYRCNKTGGFILRLIDNTPEPTQGDKLLATLQHFTERLEAGEPIMVSTVTEALMAECVMEEATENDPTDAEDCETTDRTDSDDSRWARNGCPTINTEGCDSIPVKNWDSTNPPPLPPCACVCGSNNVIVDTSYAVYRVGCHSCRRSTARYPTEQAARDEWAVWMAAIAVEPYRVDIIADLQAELAELKNQPPGTVQIQLPEPPEEAGILVGTSLRKPDESEWFVQNGTWFEATGYDTANTLIVGEFIAPTPEEIREKSQAWAAVQVPGTVAVKDGSVWFWNGDEGTLWICESEWKGEYTNVLCRVTGNWQRWDPRLDGIGPDDVVYSPGEKGGE